MKRNILWIFLAAASLVSASSLGSFDATCSGITCSGTYNLGPADTFGFDGPFPDGRASAQYDPNFPYNPFIDLGIGTNGGVFSFQGHTCDYDNALYGPACDAEVLFGAYLGPPDGKGLSLGDVVSVKGTGIAQGFWVWGENQARPGYPVFNLNVTATYQFTLTNPGSSSPFTWTAAQFSSVPEPGIWVSVALGLAGIAAGRRERRRRAQRNRAAENACISEC